MYNVEKLKLEKLKQKKKHHNTWTISKSVLHPSRSFARLNCSIFLCRSFVCCIFIYCAFYHSIFFILFFRVKTYIRRRRHTHKCLYAVCGRMIMIESANVFCAEAQGKARIKKNRRILHRDHCVCLQSIFLLRRRRRVYVVHKCVYL